MLKKVVKLNLEDLWLFVGFEGGIFLLAQIVTCGVMAFGGPDNDSIMLMGVILPIVAGFVVVLCGISYVTLNFDQALRFGQTRRRALGQTCGLLLFQGAFGMGLAAALTALERYVMPHLWAFLQGKEGFVIQQEVRSGAVTVPDDMWDRLLNIDSFHLDWYAMPAILLAGLLIGFILGALMQRFGAKAGWVIYAAVMVACFGPQLLDLDAFAIGNWGPVMGVTGIVLAAVGLVWSVWSALHAVVKN